MCINNILQQKNITKYRLSQISGVPYTTISDICNNKVHMSKCTAETIYKIAKALNVSMELLLRPTMEINKRCTFENFKSNVCHSLKRLGDIDFLIKTIEEDEITKYYNQKWYAESLYLLAMVDYISTINNIPLCTRYNALREVKLPTTIFPVSIIAETVLTQNKALIESATKEAIPEFLRFNIVESDVRNVV